MSGYAETPTPETTGTPSAIVTQSTQQSAQAYFGNTRRKRIHLGIFVVVIIAAVAAVLLRRSKLRQISVFFFAVREIRSKGWRDCSGEG